MFPTAWCSWKESTYAEHLASQTTGTHCVSITTAITTAILYMHSAFLYSELPAAAAQPVGFCSLPLTKNKGLSFIPFPYNPRLLFGINLNECLLEFTSA